MGILCQDKLSMGLLALDLYFIFHSKGTGLVFTFVQLQCSVLLHSRGLALAFICITYALSSRCELQCQEGLALETWKQSQKGDLLCMESNIKLSLFLAFLTGGGLCCMKALSISPHLFSSCLYC